MLEPLNSFPASGNFCHLLLTFASSLDPDQAQQNVGPDLDPNLFDTLMVFLKDFFEKVNLKKNPQMTKKACKITQHAELTHYCNQTEDLNIFLHT